MFKTHASRVIPNRFISRCDQDNPPHLDAEEDSDCCGVVGLVHADSSSNCSATFVFVL